MWPVTSRRDSCRLIVTDKSEMQDFPSNAPFNLTDDSTFVLYSNTAYLGRPACIGQKMIACCITNSHCMLMEASNVDNPGIGASTRHTFVVDE